jgi:hypothetical protein
LSACITGFIEQRARFASHYFRARPATAGNDEGKRVFLPRRAPRRACGRDRCTRG